MKKVICMIALAAITSASIATLPSVANAQTTGKDTTMKMKKKTMKMKKKMKKDTSGTMPKM